MIMAVRTHNILSMTLTKIIQPHVPFAPFSPFCPFSPFIPLVPVKEEQKSDVPTF
jgi:hypothetical protein